MRYIVIIFLGLSLPALAFGLNIQNDTNTSSKILQRKIQQDAGKNLCNPGQELHMTPFN